MQADSLGILNLHFKLVQTRPSEELMQNSQVESVFLVFPNLQIAENGAAKLARIDLTSPSLALGRVA
jgi:hypothetical protein